MLQKLFALMGMMILLTGCMQMGEETAVADESTPEPEAPAAVFAARDAALDYLREGANECVPPEMAQWRVHELGRSVPDGFAVYRFTAETCTITVTYALAETAEPVYHVAVGDSSGFCWQAVVNENGRVIQTGSAAIHETDVGNPSAVYCTEQGYQYEVITLENGSLCGACVFPDGSSCRSWDYFHGDCQPDN